VFNTKTRQGRVLKNVRLIIYNRDEANEEETRGTSLGRVNRSRYFWLLVIGFVPGVVWAQTTASPKASLRASTRAQASPGVANKKTGATEKGGNADAKKGPNALGGDDSAKGPTEITAKDEVQFDGSARTAIFVGNVKVIDPQFTMTTDKLTVLMNKQEDGGGIKEAHAEGNVIIVHANPRRITKPRVGLVRRRRRWQTARFFHKHRLLLVRAPGLRRKWCWIQDARQMQFTMRNRMPLP